LLTRGGRTIYYVSANAQGLDNSIRRWDTNTGADREVVRADGDHAIRQSLSPDERLLAYWDGRRIRVVSVEGGAARDLFQPRPGIYFDRVAGTAWSADGRFVYFTARDGEKLGDRTVLWRVPAAGSEPQQVLAMPGESILAPNLHPDGKRIAFSTTQTRNEVWAFSNLLPGQKAAR
jgi:Tol biopolymer transport system component